MSSTQANLRADRYLTVNFIHFHFAVVRIFSDIDEEVKSHRILGLIAAITGATSIVAIYYGSLRHDQGINLVTHFIMRFSIITSGAVGIPFLVIMRNSNMKAYAQKEIVNIFN